MNSRGRVCDPNRRGFTLLFLTSTISLVVWKSDLIPKLFRTLIVQLDVRQMKGIASSVGRKEIAMKPCTPRRAKLSGCWWPALYVVVQGAAKRNQDSLLINTLRRGISTTFMSCCNLFLPVQISFCFVAVGWVSSELNDLNLIKLMKIECNISRFFLVAPCKYRITSRNTVVPVPPPSWY